MRQARSLFSILMALGLASALGCTREEGRPAANAPNEQYMQPGADMSPGQNPQSGASTQPGQFGQPSVGDQTAQPRQPSANTQLGQLGQPGPDVTGQTGQAGGSDQAARGQALFAQNCAKCHGNGGEGTRDKAPPLVGASALPLAPPRGAKKRNVQFHTAADVLQWIKANMPADAPGSLTSEQYAAILAFDLKANGVDTKGATVDAASTPTIVLHR